MHKSHERALEALARRGRRRALAVASGADFASNDYLGLASSRELKDAAKAAIARDVPVGAGGSRLLRGNHREHEALETEAAAFFGAESALFFSGGFMANVAIFSTLPKRGDLVVHDALIHASVHDGMRLTPLLCYFGLGFGFCPSFQNTSCHRLIPVSAYTHAPALSRGQS